MITISAVIGIGILHGDSEALEGPGPGGHLVAFFFVGVITICVIEGISEMSQMSPALKSFVEYV